MTALTKLNQTRISGIARADIALKPLNLAEPIFEHAHRQPGKPALIIKRDQKMQTVTYAEFAGRVAAAVQALTASGIVTHEHVALRVADPLIDLVQFTALTVLGIGIYPTSASSEVEREVLRRVGISACVTDDPACAITAQTISCKADLPALVDPAHWPALANYAERPWLVRASSGTTGRSKVFIPRQQEIAFRRQRYLETVGESTGGFLSFTLSHFGAARHRLFFQLCAGETVYPLRPGVSLADTVALINQYRIGMLFGVPLHLAQLVEMAPNVGLLFPHTPGLESTSSTINPELAAQVRRRVTPALVNTYAVSELGPISGPPLAATTPHVTASLLPADASDIGQPLAGVVVQILDAAGQPLPAGQTGQIAVRFADDSLDVRYLDPSGDWVSGLHGGWFLPGDLGRMSADGRLAFFGRADDLIIFNGINIYPSEIEQAARLCAGVRDACAFGVPSQMHQQIPFVAIIPEPGFVSDAFLREIGERLGNRMPRRCLTVPEFPRNAMGKLLRRALIEQVTAEILRSPRASSLSIGPLNHGSPSQPPALPRRFAGDQKFEVKLPLTRPMPATVADWAAPLLGKPDWGPPPQLPPALVALQDSASQRLAVFEQLSRLLLTLARVPLFTPLTINSCRLKWAGTATPADTSDGKEGGTPQWQITWRVPIEPFLPRAVYIGALKGALKMIAWIERTAPTPDVIATVYAQIERKLVMPLKALVPAGASTIPVLAVAHELGIPYFHLGMGVYQLGWGARARRLDRSMVEADSALGSKLAQSKHVTANLLHMAGLPAPVHKVVLNSDQAKDAARELGYPLVVKPADLDRGEGVTVDIDGEVALLSAFEAARALSRSKQVIVERQVPGLCHRLFVQDGRLLYAVQRGPMSVCGDGRSSVRALIEQGLAEDAWRPPWQRSDLKPLDALAEAELARNGLSADSVPAVGQAVALRRIESTGWGGVDVEVTTIVHPDNLAVALAAAKLFSLNVAGIDIITPDITVPWHANGAIVNEVNSAPLLGGAEISRSHLPAFLDRLMGGGDGRIPLLAVADLVSAQREKTALAQSGLRAWITSAAQTHDPDGQPLPMVVRGLHARVQALLCRADVEALIINADSR